MNLKVISTGSKGNMYLLETTIGTLILDAGVPIKKLVRTGIEFRKIAGCVITHEHGDHAKSAKDLAARGIKIYASEGTKKAVGVPQIQTLKAGEMAIIGQFMVLAFKAQHDAAEPLGFLIRFIPTGETAIYATDTFYLANTFPGVHYWLVECNWCDEMAKDTDAALYDRLCTSHMSLRHLEQTLAANDLREARKIVLIHLSDERSDEKLMVDRIGALTEIETVAAADGMDIPLELTPF